MVQKVEKKSLFRNITLLFFIKLKMTGRDVTACFDSALA
jgi:hypothetical protein